MSDANSILLGFDDIERLHWERGERHGDDWGLQVADEHNEIFVRLLEGRTIVKVERDVSSSQDWSHGENSVTLTLDDGSSVSFSGWGYDASGLDTTYHPATESTTCTAKLHRVKPHPTMGRDLEYDCECILHVGHGGQHDSGSKNERSGDRWWA